jgi:peptidoglycan/LPS O-acetylase OafA/YrhL
LALGSLLAIGLADNRARKIIAKAGPFALSASILAIAILYPKLVAARHLLFCNAFAYSLVSIAAASMLAHILLRPTGWIARMFSWKPIVFVGRISYGLYLYHVVVLIALQRIFVRLGYTHGMRVIVISALVSIGLAWLSFRFYETPFLNWGKRKIGYYHENSNSEYIDLIGPNNISAARS